MALSLLSRLLLWTGQFNSIVKYAFRILWNCLLSHNLLQHSKHTIHHPLTDWLTEWVTSCLCGYRNYLLIRRQRWTKRWVILFIICSRSFRSSAPVAVVTAAAAATASIAVLWPLTPERHLGGRWRDLCRWYISINYYRFMVSNTLNRYNSSFELNQWLIMATENRTELWATKLGYLYRNLYRPTRTGKCIVWGVDGGGAQRRSPQVCRYYWCFAVFVLAKFNGVPVWGEAVLIVWPGYAISISRNDKPFTRGIPK